MRKVSTSWGGVALRSILYSRAHLPKSGVVKSYYSVSAVGESLLLVVGLASSFYGFYLAVISKSFFKIWNYESQKGVFFFFFFPKNFFKGFTIILSYEFI